MEYLRAPAAIAPAGVEALAMARSSIAGRPLRVT
jgi:hypothetical protein